MTAAERELIRLELSRGEREIDGGALAFRLLDCVEVTPDVCRCGDYRITGHRYCAACVEGISL